MGGKIEGILNVKTLEKSKKKIIRPGAGWACTALNLFFNHARKSSISGLSLLKH
jgi:hypothetical protein